MYEKGDRKIDSELYKPVDSRIDNILSISGKFKSLEKY